MQSLYCWLEKEDSFSREFLLFLAFLSSSIFLYLFLGTLFGYPLGLKNALSLTPYSIMIIVKNAFGEEAVFRLIPFVLFFFFVKRRGASFLIFLLAQSFIFGYVHTGLISMLALGPVGIVLSLAYLKFGGFFNRPLRGFVFSAGIHSLINLSLHGLSMCMRS